MAQAMVKASAMTLPAVNDDLNGYLSKISSFPVLSVEEEQSLARKYRDDDDLESAGQMVMSQLRFVVHLARSYSGYGLPLADLVQEGNIGLMKVQKFTSTLFVTGALLKSLPPRHSESCSLSCAARRKDWVGSRLPKQKPLPKTSVLRKSRCTKWNHA